MVAPKRAKLVEAEGTYEGVMTGLREKQKELQVRTGPCRWWAQERIVWMSVKQNWSQASCSCAKLP